MKYKFALITALLTYSTASSACKCAKTTRDLLLEADRVLICKMGNTVASSELRADDVWEFQDQGDCSVRYQLKGKLPPIIKLLSPQQYNSSCNPPRLIPGMHYLLILGRSNELTPCSGTRILSDDESDHRKIAFAVERALNSTLEDSVELDRLMNPFFSGEVPLPSNR
ncbi:hypothetical protein [Pseudomarimonas arenosa]|uniref:Uncharacterized protein n=1 Tax=Pseudomarimonas arenosa TaxID=2774145 RepID=A0AAW3ZWD8_9GAMM|nr:hypothetical protein [Pseudomarimonas arenosa]MBD8528326.1 hypothetical protein [Pseudomarimonas arenosa]